MQTLKLTGTSLSFLAVSATAAFMHLGCLGVDLEDDPAVGSAEDAISASCANVPSWAAGVAYTVGMYVQYQGKAYKVIQSHTSLAGWTPNVVPALFNEVSDCPGGGTSSSSSSSSSSGSGGSGGAGGSGGSGGAGGSGGSGGAGGSGGGGPIGGDRLLIGYWHNFDNGSGFIKLKDVSPDWDIINVSFAEPTGASQTIAFTPYGYATVAEFKNDVNYLKSQGKKVVISIGGANGHVQLPTTAARDNFVSSMKSIITTYGFDGMDIDFEGNSLYLNSGDTDVKNPTTPVIKNLISAIRSVHDHYGPNFVLTMAPETFFVQVGYTNYGGLGGGDARAGAYLPVIHAVRDILDVLQVQHYNSGPVVGLDDQYHFMGNADFHVAMAELVLKGFPVAHNANNFFPALRPDQVAIGLPAVTYAGNGYTPEAEVRKAVNYLVKGQSYGGSYTLKNPAGYPGLRGLMSWSINWDAYNQRQFSTSHRAFLDGL